MIFTDRTEIARTIAQLSREGKHDELGQYIADLFQPNMAVVCYGDDGYIERFQKAFKELHQDDIFIPLSTKEFNNKELWVKVGGNVRRKSVYVLFNFTGYEDARKNLLEFENEFGADSGKFKDYYHRVTTSNFDPNIGYMRLFLINHTLKLASADMVTDVLSSIAYLRQDRKDEGRVPISAKVFADLTRASGADRVVTFDMHSPQGQGFYDIPVDNLTALPMLIDYLFMDKDPKEIADKVVFVAPDAGAMATVVDLRKYCRKKYGVDIYFAMLEKKGGEEKTDSGRLYDMLLLGEEIMKDREAWMIDDMVDTATTAVYGGRKLRSKGAKNVRVIATHPFLSPKEHEGLPTKAEEKLQSEGIGLLTTDSIPREPEYFEKYDNIKARPLATLLADVVHRIDSGGSVSELFAHWD